jgi:hypothetical protein
MAIGPGFLIVNQNAFSKTKGFELRSDCAIFPDRTAAHVARPSCNHVVSVAGIALFPPPSMPEDLTRPGSSPQISLFNI